MNVYDKRCCGHYRRHTRAVDGTGRAEKAQKTEPPVRTRESIESLATGGWSVLGETSSGGTRGGGVRATPRVSGVSDTAPAINTMTKTTTDRLLHVLMFSYIT